MFSFFVKPRGITTQSSFKMVSFRFYTVYKKKFVKISPFWIIILFTSRNVFYFSSKKLEVVTIARYLNTFWIFDFSLLDILPKYMNPKLMSRSLYALGDLHKSPAADGRVRTDIDF